MSQKRFCDYCVREIIADARYVTMAVTTMEPDGTRQQTRVFEFHGACFNTLQGLITQLRGANPVDPVDPTPPPPPDQPVDPNDPTPPTPPVPDPNAPGRP